MKQNTPKRIYIVTAFLTYILVTFSAWATGTGFTNEFWISTNATGNFYTSGAVGTLDSPLDGSSQANFDSNMQSLPPYSTIHILAGIYQTYGVNTWQVKTGQKLMGSGIDVTILQFPSGTPEYGSGTAVIQSYYTGTNMEISDLTCDCNYTSGAYTYHGVGLDGTGNVVRRVKVIHCAKYNAANSEAWGIVLANGSVVDSTGNLIEDCEVSHFAGGGGAGSDAISAISFNGPCMSGIIRGNHVVLNANSTGSEIGLNGR
jgi:hypothetical protein